MWNWKEKRQRNGIDNGQLRIDNSPRGKYESNQLRSTANWCLARSALPSPLGKVPQCAHWGGRGLTSDNNSKHAVIYGKTPKSSFFTNCTANTYPVPSLFSHPNRFRRADWGASFPKGEAMTAARQTTIYLCRFRLLSLLSMALRSRARRVGFASPQNTAAAV